MAALINAKREAFAQAMADGAEPGAAARAAGYKHSGNGLQEEYDIIARVEEIRLHRLGGGSRDPGPLMDYLMEMAIAARDRGTPQDFKNTVWMFDLIGKLKAQLPDPSSTPPAPVLLPHDVVLTDAEWMARYGPEAPGGKPDWSPK